MTDELRQFLREVFIVISSGGVTLFVQYILQHGKTKQEKKDAAAERSLKTIDIQGETLSDAFKEIRSLRDEVIASNKLQRIQWVYIIKLLEGYKNDNRPPPDPPDELSTDPVIIRLIKSITPPDHKPDGKGV